MAHKLLLADDSPTIQRVVELTFANEDVDVVAVGDGAQAIAAIEDDEPDIVLADVSMPGKDGYEVASFVRRDPGRARIPVVLLTGAFEPLDASRCDAIGRHDVLIKPFEPREIVGKVRALLDPAASADPSPDGQDAAGAEAPESAEDETETSAGEEISAREAEGANEEARTAEDETDPDESSAAVVAAGPARAGRSTDGASDPSSSAGAENATSPSEPGDPSPVAAGADAAASLSKPGDPSPVAAGEEPGDPPALSAERAVEDEAAAPLPGDPTSGGAAPAPAGRAGGSVLAQSFVTFLAVEQGAAPPAPPAASPSAAAGGAKPVLPEAVMDDLVDRVVARLTDTVLRDTVAEVVSRLAERLGREEITRVPPGRE